MHSSCCLSCSSSCRSVPRSGDIASRSWRQQPLDLLPFGRSLWHRRLRSTLVQPVFRTSELLAAFSHPLALSAPVQRLRQNRWPHLLTANAILNIGSDACPELLSGYLSSAHLPRPSAGTRPLHPCSCADTHYSVLAPALVLGPYQSLPHSPHCASPPRRPLFRARPDSCPRHICLDTLPIPVRQILAPVPTPTPQLSFSGSCSET